MCDGTRNCIKYCVEGQYLAKALGYSNHHCLVTGDFGEPTSYG